MKKFLSISLTILILFCAVAFADAEETIKFKMSGNIISQPAGTPLRNKNISENFSEIVLNEDENAIIVRFMSQNPYRMEYYISLYDVDKEIYVTDMQIPGCPKNMIGPISEGEFKFTNLRNGGKYRMRLATAINCFNIEAEICTAKISTITQSEYKIAKVQEPVENHVADHICFGADTTVERGQMAQMIRGLLPAETTEQTQEFNFSQEQPFFDVTDGTRAKKDIEALYWLNIVNGSGNGMFHPNKAVTNAEVIKMIVCSLGYGAYAQTLGEWPHNYIKCGEELGIFIYNDFNSEAFSRDISRLISIAYTLPHMCISEFSADGFAKFYQNENITYLNMR